MKFFTIIFALFFAQIAFAQVYISEIKYTGNDWIEVFNSGGPTDLSLWKFFEGGTNHKLVLVQGGAIVPSLGYAIIANNPTNFLAEYGGFSGILFHSSFSLLDAGESLSIKRGDGTVSDTVYYTGIKGSKNSTQNIGGTWIESTPTPGTANILAQVVGVAPQNTTPAPLAQVIKADNAQALQQAKKDTNPQVTAQAGPQTRIVIVGAPVTFEGKISGLENTHYGATHTTWSFGDGASGEGETIFHTYYYPGEYIAILDVVSGDLSATDRMFVHAIDPEISLRTGGDTAHSFIIVENLGGNEIDISTWKLSYNGWAFIFPRNTILGAHKSATFASEVTGLITPEGSSVELHFPNNTPVKIKNEIKGETVSPPTTPKKIIEKPNVETTNQVRALSSPPLKQEATVLGAVLDNQNEIPQKRGGDTWPWYIGAAFLAAFALFGIRITQGGVKKGEITADDFKIIEDEDPH